VGSRGISDGDPARLWISVRLAQGILVLVTPKNNPLYDIVAAGSSWKQIRFNPSQNNVLAE
jgi:hypothetical protein